VFKVIFVGEKRRRRRAMGVGEDSQMK